MGLFDKVKKAAVKEFVYDGVDWELRTRGLKGTAEILEAKYQGDEWWDLRLRVSIPNREPYEVSLREQVFDAAVGAVVGVAVDVDDPDKFQLTDAPQVSPNGTPALEDVWTKGNPARAILRDTFSMNYIAENGDPVVGMELQIHPGGGSPYKWRHGTRVAPAALKRLEKGAEFDIRVWPDDPNRIAFDWMAP